MPVYRVPATISGWSGGPGVNVWYVRTVAEPTVDGPSWLTQLGGALDAIGDFYTDTTAYWASVSVTIGLDVTDVETGEEPAATVTPQTRVVGINPLAPKPLALCVTFKSSLKARRGTGRKFLGPLNTSLFEADGTPSTAALTAVRTAANNLVAASAASNAWAIGIWGLQDEWPSWDAGPPPKNTPRVLRDVTSAMVNDKFAVLRSRRD